MGYAERPAHRPLRAHNAPPAVRTSRSTMRIPRTKKLLSFALGLIVLGCVWFWVAPVGLGGSTTYVVTHGVSMEPRFHTGDLALVRSQSSYHVGEVVAYHNKELHTIVLHRIIGRAGARYIFKGDNNNFVDFEHPAASQLIGALWLHIPGAGADLQSIRSPALVGVLVAVGILLLTGAAFARRRRLRRRERRGGASSPPPLPRLPRGPAMPALGLLVIGLLALLPFLVLALLAFTRPPTALHPYAIPYKQSGTLSYSAEASPGPTYPNGQAVTGDPLFTRVLKTVEFSFGYRFRAADRHPLSGKVSLDATAAASDGWHTTIKLAPPTRFRGDRALVTGTLNLTSLLALIHSVETTTKVRGSYTLTLVPRVSATGNLGAVPLHTTFAPEIKFLLSELEIQPAVASSSSPSVGSAGEPSAESPFAPSAPGSATGTRPQPLSLSFGVAQMSVASARRIALYGIALVVLALLALLACLRLMLVRGRSRPRDESASIRARYGRMIVPVARVWQLPGVPVIDVEDMEALAQIAEHYDRSILHEVAEDGEAFWVTDESGQFRYALGMWTDAVEDEPVEEYAGETLVHEAYAHEPKLAGPIAVHSAPPADDTFAADAVTQGEWTPRQDGGRGRSHKPGLV